MRTNLGIGKSVLKMWLHCIHYNDQLAWIWLTFFAWLKEHGGIGSHWDRFFVFNLFFRKNVMFNIWSTFFFTLLLMLNVCSWNCSHLMCGSSLLHQHRWTFFSPFKISDYELGMIFFFKVNFWVFCNEECKSQKMGTVWSWT